MFSYITASKVIHTRKSLRSLQLTFIVKSGISDNELEDILSLDDKVLNRIYEDQIPEVRRVPAILVMKIKKEIQSFLECIEADGAHVFRWN